MFIKSATGKADAATATAAITPAAGNILVVSGFSNSSGTVSITDTAGHTWTKVGGAAMAGGYGTSGIWYAYNVKGQATTVSVTGGGNSGYVIIAELSSSTPTLDPFDGISLVASGTVSPAVTNAVATTVGADTLVGIYHTAGFNFAAGSGWSNPVSIAGYIVGGMESRDVTTTGSYTATATLDGGSSWQGYVLAFGVDPTKRTTAAKYATTATQTSGTWTNPNSATGAPNSTGGTANTTGTVPNNCAYWSNAAASSTAALTLSGYNFATEVGSNTITGVTATIGHAESSTTTISALTAQLYSGTTAIGTAQAITRSTTYTTATISSWGALPTAAQLADLRVRITATHNTGTTTRILYVDAVGLSVNYNVPAGPTPITWQGRTWTPRTVAGAPGPNTWDPSQVWVDTSGYLNLRISQIGGVWTCAELDQSDGVVLGYGSYQFVYEIDVATRDPNVVFGLFTYNDDAASAPSHQELDVEITKWGNASDPSDLWYTEQFVNNPLGTSTENRQAAATMAGAVGPFTSTIVWQAGQVYWTTVDANGKLLGEHVVTEGVPAPSATGPEVIFNLWLNNGTAPANGLPVIAKVRSLTFTPNITHALAPAADYTDAFVDAYGWQMGNGASITAGALNVPCVPSYAYGLTGSILDMRGSSVTIHTTQAVASGGANSQEMQFQARIDSTNYAMLVCSGGSLSCFLMQAGVKSTQTFGPAFNLATHAYWRISVSGTTVTFATSPNGTTWTTLGTIATTWTSAQLSAMRAALYAGYWGAETGSQGAWRVDRVGAPLAPSYNPTQFLPFF